MIRSTIALCALTAALTACPAGKRHGPDGNVQPGAHQLVILTPPGRTIRLQPSGQVTLAVRYLDPQGAPVGDAQIAFSLQGNTGGATLAGFHAITDHSGTAEMLLTAGAESVIFNVEVNAVNALPVQFEVAVSATGFADVELLSAYDGPRSATAFDQVVAELHYGDLCADLDPVGENDPDRTRSAPDGFGDRLLFDNLPAELDYAFALRGIDPDGRYLAWGCADVTSLQLVPGTTLQLGLAAHDLHPDATGTFQVSTALTLTPDQATRVHEALIPWAELARCGLDPAQRLLDCIVDAVAPDGSPDCVVQSTSALATALQSARGNLDPNDCREAETPAALPSLEATIWEATDATGLAYHMGLADVAAVDPVMLQNVRLRSQLTLVAASAGPDYFAWHKLDKIGLPDLAPDVWLPLGQLGGLLLEAATLEAGYTVDTPAYLALPTHPFTVQAPRAALLAAHDRYLAPVGLPPDFEGILDALLQAVHYPDAAGTLRGCAAVDAYLCDAIAGRILCPPDACASGVALLLDLAQARWNSLPTSSEPDLTLAAQVPLVTGDGDLTVDHLGSPSQPVDWAAALNLSGTWAPMTEATFSASRVSPIPQ